MPSPPFARVWPQTRSSGSTSTPTSWPWTPCRSRTRRTSSRCSSAGLTSSGLALAGRPFLDLRESDIQDEQARAYGRKVRIHLDERYERMFHEKQLPARVGPPDREWGDPGAGSARAEGKRRQPDQPSRARAEGRDADRVLAPRGSEGLRMARARTRARGGGKVKNARPWAILACTVRALALAVPAMAEIVAIENVRVWDGTSERLTAPTRVVVEGNRIARVGGEPTAAADRVIDGGGRTLMPGLIDSHTHLNMTFQQGGVVGFESATWEEIGANAVASAREFLMNGFTTVRDTGGMGTGLKRDDRPGAPPGSPHLHRGRVRQPDFRARRPAPPEPAQRGPHRRAAQQRRAPRDGQDRRRRAGRARGRPGELRGGRRLHQDHGEWRRLLAPGPDLEPRLHPRGASMRRRRPSATGIPTGRPTSTTPRARGT